jgi:hypothetical protein
MADTNPRSTTRPFRFFDLPHEIRDIIYDEVWPHTPYLYQATLQCKPSPLICIVAQYRKEAEKWKTYNRFPPWLLANHAFLNEAMEQYFQNIDWRVRIPGSLFTTRIYLSSSGHRNDVWRELDFELSRVLQGDKTVDWIPTRDYSRNVPDIFNWPMGLQILKKMEPGLRATNKAKQKTLFVTLGIASTPTRRIDRVNLSGLEATRLNVDDLVVDVKLTKCDSNQLVDRVQNLFMMEIGRFRNVLLCRPTSRKMTLHIHQGYGGDHHWTFKVSKA